jgi:hypothetical protein
MGRLRSNGLSLLLAIIFLSALAGCGGGSKPGPPLFAGHITITPASNASLLVGNTLNFTASAQTASGTNLAVPITFSSTDTSILNLSSTGVACAGHWDANFTTCTPGNTGVVQVTASALGATSIPIYVFVHPKIDNITVSGVLLDGVPVQEPCLSQNQTMTVEAHAFSQGQDITPAVGPFSWTASNPSVVALVPLTNTAYNFATNQATARASIPGISKIFATASGVTSTSFQQPQYQAQNTTSPVLDFFATCAIQNISLEVGAAGSGQTSFAVSKSTSQNIVATITDIMGNSSLPNTNGGIILSRIPLTWTSSHPAVLSVASGCSESCTATAANPGAATITASCSPPTCNVGYPTVPASLSTAAQINACTQFFQASAPPGFSCQQLIPTPVYASPVFISDARNPGSDVLLQPPIGAIGGVASGAPTTAPVFATSTGCAHQPPAACSTSTYFFSTAKAVTNAQNPLPVSPNSFLYTLAGDKIYMGSDFGAEIITPSNFGTTTSPFTSLGTVTGTALAVANSGTVAAFADTLHTPNQVYIVNTTTASSPTATALTIPAATAAAFSPDGTKTFIAGGTAGNSLYVYSGLQALQGPISLSGSANAIAFAPNGAFAFVAEAAAGSSNLTAFATCNNQVAATLALPASPILMKVIPNVHMDGKDSYGNSIPDGIHILILDATGFDIATATISAPPAGNLCPESLTFKSNDPLRTAQRIELGQGTLQPLNFFVSGDGTQIYIANANNSTILIYNFVVGSIIGGIELLNGATPVSAEMSSDAGTIVVAGSDNMVHEVSTSVGGADLVQLPFPNLPNYLNPFCTSYNPAQCTLNVALTRP